MWRHLRLSNLGVIADAALDFGPGFTVITGETGAGKTMVVTALGLLRGERAEATLVRHGQKQARIEAEIDASTPIEEIVEEYAGDIDDGVALLARVLSDQGRSRAFLGGASVPVNALAKVSEHSVAVHGQADQYRLLRPAPQREALDEFAGLDQALRNYRGEYAEYVALRRRIDDIRSSSLERERELDQLRFSLNEIDEIAPEAGEDQQLGAESQRLGHIESLMVAARETHALLLGGDDAVGGAIAAIGEAATNCEGVADHDPALAEIAGRLRDASYVIADIGTDIGAYLADLDADPARLQQVEMRRADLARLTRKYGTSIDEVLAWANEARTRIDELVIDEEGLEELDHRLTETGSALLASASKIHALRVDAAARLSESVQAELRELALPHAQFDVRLTAPDTPTTGDLTPDGFDTVEFYFTANSGTEPRPLAKGASGGELSRVMLALEVALIDTRSVPTLVFDEVDAGIGGRAAVEVGRRLSRLAQKSQVFAVTHLPQVAAFADHHFHVEKSVDGSVTASSVIELTGQRRVDEISRMLAGVDSSASAQEHARELLGMANQIN